jgi:hypothetical protein
MKTKKRRVEWDEKSRETGSVNEPEQQKDSFFNYDFVIWRKKDGMIKYSYEFTYRLMWMSWILLEEWKSSSNLLSNRK